MLLSFFVFHRRPQAPATLRTRWAMSLRPQSVRVCPVLPPRQLWSPSMPLSCSRSALVSPLTQASVITAALVQPHASPPSQQPFPPRCSPLLLTRATHTARATSPTWNLCLTLTSLRRTPNRHRDPCISSDTHTHARAHTPRRTYCMFLFSLLLFFIFFLFYFIYKPLTTAYGQAIGSTHVCVCVHFLGVRSHRPSCIKFFPIPCMFSRSWRENGHDKWTE